MPKTNGKKKNPVGRPRLKIDVKQVEQLASIQCSYAEIAMIVGCSTAWLSKNCYKVIKRGRGDFAASLKRQQYRVAMGSQAIFDDQGNELEPYRAPHPSMLMFLGKVHLGMVEASKLELTGELEVTNVDTVRTELEERISSVAARIGPEGVLRFPVARSANGA